MVLIPGKKFCIRRDGKYIEVQVVQFSHDNLMALALISGEQKLQNIHRDGLYVLDKW